MSSTVQRVALQKQARTSHAINVLRLDKYSDEHLSRMQARHPKVTWIPAYLPLGWTSRITVSNRSLVAVRLSPAAAKISPMRRPTNPNHLVCKPFENTGFVGACSWVLLCTCYIVEARAPEARTFAYSTYYAFR